jgi:hypothetical protein
VATLEGTRFSRATASVEERLCFTNVPDWHQAVLPWLQHSIRACCPACTTRHFTLAPVRSITGGRFVALEGNLKDFSLADMFRLLQTGSKSGTLHIAHDGVEGLVCFHEGRVVHATSTGEVEPVGKRLTRAGIISDKQLRQAQGLMKIQKKDKAKRRLGQILVDEGYLEASVLEDFMVEQVSDVLFDLLRWEDGELRFESAETCGDADIGIYVAVDSVLANAGKRLEAWNRIREKIPSLDTRFRMAASPGARSVEIHLKPREWMMLCHLHGAKTVGELVELTGQTDFETARILYGMYAGGLIEKVGATGEPVGD